jgi:hypothetical protein
MLGYVFDNVWVISVDIIAAHVYMTFSVHAHQIDIDFQVAVVLRYREQPMNGRVIAFIDHRDYLPQIFNLAKGKARADFIHQYLIGSLLRRAEVFGLEQ